MIVEEILSKMTLEDKIALCSGLDFFHTKAMDRYGIPSIMVADGPHGLRKQEIAADMLGIHPSVPATCFPTAVSTACSWDEKLIGKIGEVIAGEAVAHHVSVILGPGANIKRDPLCGRNFEYFSEDPLLTGKLAGAFIRGVEATGIGSSLKHFAFNNQEYKRFSSDSIMDERTMREIYLTGFETAIKEGKPSTVMSAYNKINGEHCSDSKMLLTDILRDEWGFDGLVMTDWGGSTDRIKGFQAGCDLVMPGGSAYMEPEAKRAVADGSLNEADIDACAERVLRLVFSKIGMLGKSKTTDMNANHAFARKAAEESAVLMKNEDHVLPLSPSQKVVFIGAMAKTPRYQGSGSSLINPWKVVSAVDACPEIPFLAGCNENGETTDDLLREAEDGARSADVAVVFAGLPGSYESEGYERDDMNMPDGYTRMIEAIAQANGNTVVVLSCGSAVELPWNDKVKAVLYMGLPGQAGGEAIRNLLFGYAVPCGKLAESWPIKYEDCVCSSYYAGNRKDAHYREGIYVGYRYYSSANKQVQYAFGHGLSYAAFAYSNLAVKGNDITVHVTNTGAVPAKEVVQLYVTPPMGAFYRPVKELKAFTKILLKPGETKTVTLPLSERSFAIWNNGWVVPEGTYTISVGGSSENLPVSITVKKNGPFTGHINSVPAWYFRPDGYPSQQDWEEMLGKKVLPSTLKKGEFTIDNTIMEMKDDSLIMRIMYKAIELTVAKGFNGKKDYTNPKFRMMMNSAADASISGIRISGGMKNYILEGMLEMANGHFFKGLRLMWKK